MSRYTIGEPWNYHMKAAALTFNKDLMIQNVVN